MTANVYIANPTANHMSLEMSVSDSELQSRIAKSNVILSGRVSDIRPINSSIVSEHDPDFTLAVIKVDEVIKGNLSKEIQTLFSNSYDVSWHNAPKLRVGDYGIFFLRQKEKIQNANVEAYTLLNRGDFQPINPASIHDLDRIKKLVKSATS
jgi:hypothetical protein